MLRFGLSLLLLSSSAHLSAAAAQSAGSAASEAVDLPPLNVEAKKPVQKKSATSRVAPKAQAKTSPSSEPAPAPSSAGSGDGVVYAQGYPQGLFEVPISLRAFDAEELEFRRVTRLEDAFAATPNVSLTSQRGGNDAANISIRGVTNTAFGPDAAVGIFVDGVYVGADNAFNTSMHDLKQIEILRGPQGTLYGRNALGGVVNIFTENPVIGETSAIVETTVGSYGRLSGVTTFNLGISQDAAARVVLFGDHSDGWISNFAGGDDYGSLSDAGGRAKLLFNPTDTWEVIVSADYVEDDGRRAAFGPIDTVWDQGIAQLNPFRDEVKSYGTSIQSNWLTDFGKVTSITAWRGVEGEGFGGNYTMDPNPSAGFSRDYDQITQELRATGATRALNWTLGTYTLWSQEDRYEAAGMFLGLPADTYYPGQPELPPMFEEGSSSDNSSFHASVFGDLTWHATDRLDVIGGVRVSYDRKSIDYVHGSNVPGFTLYAPAAEFSDSMNEVTVMPRGGLSYEVIDGIRAYGLISRGGKTGGYNISFVSNDRYGYDPETVTNYEIGLKGSSPNGRLHFDASVFYMDWRDQQYYQFDIPTNSLVALNAPKSRSYGAEVSLGADLTPGLRFWLGGGYQDARFIRKGDTPSADDGNWQPNASEFSANAMLTHTVRLTDSVRLLSNVQYDWRSSFFWDAANTMEASGYGLVDASIGLEWDNWSVTAFTENLFDQEHFVRAERYAAGVYAVPGVPRTFGVTAKAKF